MSERSKGDQILDLYWSGPERRISGLTLRIIGVNAVALVILIIGVLYLGDYQRTLVSSKLEAFQSDAELVAASISSVMDARGLKEQEAGDIVRNLLSTRSFAAAYGGEKHVMVFEESGGILSDSRTPPLASARISMPPVRELESVKILKNAASFVLGLLPAEEPLPPYPALAGEAKGPDYPGVAEALSGKISLSAWMKEDGLVFLSAAAPIQKNGKILGAILLTRDARDIQHDVSRLWLSILRIFVGTLLITVLLSIYLSGTIADPLRKLARAAESIRAGRSRAADIPDFSGRFDEIGELSVTLRHMTEALWNRMDRIERFAAEVAHELKNPLTSLKSAAETALRIKKREDLDKLLGIIIHDADRMTRLISDISAASRLDTELSREKLAPLDMEELVHSLLDSYQPGLERGINTPKSGEPRIVKAGKIAIRFEPTGSGPFRVLGSEGRLLQVLDNLLSNALSFSPKTGAVVMALKAEGHQVELTVEDQGPGIPDGKLDAIFERFYSERPDHEDFGNHSGLGLSICKQIMEAHNGRIFAENIKGAKGRTQGARFRALLSRA